MMLNNKDYCIDKNGVGECVIFKTNSIEISQKKGQGYSIAFFVRVFLCVNNAVMIFQKSWIEILFLFIFGFLIVLDTQITISVQ